MNRRKFCQTTALFLAGSLCTGVSLRSEKCATRFRAQKIFLKSWDAENNGQKILENISRDGCHAVLLIPGGRNVSSVEMERIASGASRFDLKVLVPTCLTRDLLGRARAILPLSHEAGILQNIVGKPADSGGFLLLDIADELLGLVLYDSSLCLWKGFSIPRVGFRQNPKDGESGSRLMTAKWLDYAIFDHYCSGIQI